MGERVKGKVAVVIGAGSVGSGVGNGKASAILYAREGASVMAVDCNLEACEETKHLIDEEGGDCITYEADVSKSIDCKNIIEKCIQTFGRIDVLHNNVGMSGGGGIVETSEETWDTVMTVNLKSIFLTCKYALPYMEKQESGSIINISSIGSVRVQPVSRTADTVSKVGVNTLTIPMTTYTVSKAGVNALTMEIAAQYVQKGIRANVILPGLIKTPRLAFGPYKNLHTTDPDAFWRQRDDRSPTGKQGDPWDIAYAALFLASDEAKYITGITLFVDGGITNICG